MKMRDRWNTLSLTKRVVLIVSFVLLAGYGLLFATVKPVTFAYSGQDCVSQLTLFPEVHKQVGISDFVVEFRDAVVINGYPVAALKACFIATKPPTPGTAIVRTSPYGSWVFAKQFGLKVGDTPTATVSDFAGKTLPITRPVKISLSTTDEVFDYKLRVGEKTADCDHKDESLYCAIDTLELEQGVQYDTALLRHFNGQEIEKIGQGTIKTLRALVLVSGSVSVGQTVYDKPASFTFEYDKTLEAAKAVLKTKEGTVIETKVTTDGKKVLVTPKGELARNSEFILTLQHVEAIDGSALPEESVVPFTMSGGPKVVGVNIGSYGVATGGSIVVSFDQDVANFDAIATLVSVSGVAAQIQGSGKQLVINYSGDLCADFSITVKKGFKNAAAILQGDDWSVASRTICYSVQTIGYSVKGRAINAFIFGSGSKTILYTGAIHGNEQSARLLMNAWIAELDLSARSIPSGTRIVVIPSVNPDGVAANTRTNASNVDLNRNYPTSDWRQDVETVEGKPFPGGGGSSAGSEPETKALMAYTQALAPSLTMSYHASGSYAIANTCGNSGALADTYAKLTGYRNMTGVSGAFGYQITGTYDDWICEKLGRASVLIELATSTSPEFSRNKAALWAMAKS